MGGVCRMSSRDSGRKDVGMGSKAQEVGLDLFIMIYNCVIVTGLRESKIVSDV